MRPARAHARRARPTRQPPSERWALLALDRGCAAAHALGRRLPAPLGRTALRRRALPECLVRRPKVVCLRCRAPERTRRRSLPRRARSRPARLTTRGAVLRGSLLAGSSCAPGALACMALAADAPRAARAQHTRCKARGAAPAGALSPGSLLPALLLSHFAPVGLPSSCVARCCARRQSNPKSASARGVRLRRCSRAPAARWPAPEPTAFGVTRRARGRCCPRRSWRGTRRAAGRACRPRRSAQCAARSLR